MVLAECLAVATLSIGEREYDVPAQDFERAFATAWSQWPEASQFAAVRPEQIVRLLDGPRTVGDAIAHWQSRGPFRPSLTNGYREPADVAELIADYTGIPLPAWEELARGVAAAIGQLTVRD
jgi:hypothetical protein